ncbi:DUF1772 domain-containing protein [Streptomyces albofaciens JCM 4342]|uniref:anthrone oxygenase family protein n=1 Tax=Streptomyces albofaciens TaxID=66866 RepID=UPI001239C3AB|nr:anthrone oxygenase family protein [Streptomyces albofaciens]KAA6214434.1 DUF1772 domain-containing protein [Streptomyces albofaciens JCM 4342]
MYDTARTAALFTATLATGLVAGLFFAFSIAVLPGLRQADDATFVTAMQRINSAILNGWFALAFVGAPVLITAATALHLRTGARPALPWLTAALVLYAAMLAITFTVNVPLNNALDAAHAPGELSTLRAHFEDKWNRWNLVRTLTTTAALACLIRAVLGYSSLSSAGSS